LKGSSFGQVLLKPVPSAMRAPQARAVAPPSAEIVEPGFRPAAKRFDVFAPATV
jgi:hypothetical protein